MHATAKRSTINQLVISATDGTTDCTALVGNAWTSTEIDSGALQPGTPYFVRVSAINSVEISQPLSATAVCHDPPCVNPLRLAPAAPPVAPTNVFVANDKLDRTALKVKWQAPTSMEGTAIIKYLVEYSVDAFTRVNLCAGCVGSLSNTQLTLTSNTVLAANQLIALSTLTPECLVTVQSVETAWNNAQIVYNLLPNHGCDDFTAGSGNIDALHGVGSGYIVVAPIDVQYSTADQLPQIWFKTSLTGLTPNIVYSVRVRAQNTEGVGPGTVANPICEDGIESCAAAAVVGGTTIVTRQLPSAPVLVVPTQLTSQGVNAANAFGFTKNSLWVSFGDPNAWTGLEAVDWYRVEWDTQADFKSAGRQSAIVQATGALASTPSLWTNLQVCATCVTALDGTDTLTVTNPNNNLAIRVDDYLTMDAGFLVANGQVDPASCQFVVAAITSATQVKVAAGHSCSTFTGKALSLYRRNAFQYLLSGLAMGVQINIRITGHNALGYGAISDSIAVVPITTSDPPPSPDVVLSAFNAEENSDIAPEVRVSSLRVSFLPPKILLPTDLNGNGGSPITKYLVEWLDGDWVSMQKHVQVISTTSSSVGIISGAYRLTLDTTGCANCQVKSVQTTSAIAFDTSAADMTTLLQNLPNVGQVIVTRSALTAKNECTWKVTFASELDVVPDFSVTQNLLTAESGVARIQISSLVVNGGQVGSLMGINYCPSSRTVGGVVVANSGPAACGFVAPTFETPLPYQFMITGLNPGTTYFVRVSAMNALGYGIRRLSAPASMAVPFEPPSVPTSLFNPIARPVLTLAGPTSLIVSYGPPAFSGGTPITGYIIEWDPKPSFDSGNDGDALGQVVRLGAAGAKYRINGLTTAQWVYVRVYAMNGEMGAGLPVKTLSEREMPRMKPLQPHNILVSNGKTLPLGYSLNVQWSTPSDLKDALSAITSYRVEWYQRALTDPFFGLLHIQVVQTTGVLTAGSFSLALGDTSTATSTFPLQTLPGTISVVQGQNFVTTSVDLTGLLARGDVIGIDGAPYLVAATGTFSSTQLPLADATNYDTSLTATLANTRIPYAGNTRAGIPLKTPWKSIDLSYDVTPIAMKEALEMLPTVGIVHIERFPAGTVGSNNYNWYITFTTQVPAALPIPRLIVNDRGLVGANAGVSAAITQVGQAPVAFGFAVVNSAATQTGGGGYAYNITNLVNGVPYYVRVAAVNDIGMGDFASAPASLTPTRAPLALANVKVRTLAATAMELTYDQVAVSGGQPVDSYRIEYDAPFNFNSTKKQSLMVPPTTTYHRVTTAAHTGPFTAGSTFSLATIGETGFKGGFTRQVGAYVNGSQLSATNFVFRIAPDATRGFGNADFSLVFSRGEYVRVRNEVARVCLDSNVKYTLPGIATVAYNPATSVLTITTLTGNLANLVVVNTVLSIGLAMDCRATITQVVGASNLQLSHTCAPAILTTVGLPINIHWGPAVLPLCAEQNPWQVMDPVTLMSSFVSNLGTLVDPLPLFRLDTSAGVALDLVTSGIGNDAVSVLNPLTISCGDYIHLGDYYGDGPILRVRGKCDAGTNTCDCTRATAVSSIQLGCFADFTTPVSLSLDALAFATREIQSIRFSTTTGDLTHGIGGYRIKFGDEASSHSLRGGNGGANLNDDIGCLLWSSGPLSANAVQDALALEAELESFNGIDDVRVYRTFTTGPTVMVYTIEFLGVSVRGKLPAIQILDMGMNGCSAFDGTPAGTLPDVPLVKKEQLSYITIYQAPTTQAIPFDATNEDVKAALEALSSIPNVDVTRKVAKHGFDWKVTYVAFEDDGSSNASPPTIVANGFNLQAVQDPSITVTPFNRQKLDTTMFAPGGGVSIYSRVAVHNQNGFGDASIQLADQLPSAVLCPRADVLSGSELLVQWDYPWNDGGENVTEYKIEWWSATVNGGAKQSTILDHLDSPLELADVNLISISAPTLGANTYLSGTFQVGFDGQWTKELPYDLSAVLMQSALKNLSTIEDVEVNRILDTKGYTWMVTFFQQKYKGNQYKQHLSRLDPSKSHKLSVSGANLLVCTTSFRDNCIPKLANGIGPSISVGTTQEIQGLTCSGAPSAAAGFKLSYMGVQTALIGSDGTVADVEKALEDILVAGAVSVSFRDPAQTTICMVTNPSALLITFGTEQGDVNLLSTATVGAGLGVNIVELRKGGPQMIPGRLPYSYVISGLVAANTYNVRVAAYNSIGFGASTVAQPLHGVTPAPRAPSTPQSLSVRTRLSSSTLLMVWEEPLTNGGSAVTSYRVEWDENPSLTSQCGERSEVQTLVSKTAAQPTAGDSYRLMVSSSSSTVVDCFAWDAPEATLQTKIRALGGVYANAMVSRYGDGTARWDFGFTYTVTFVNPVTSSTSQFPLQIPLLAVDNTDATCNSYQGVVIYRDHFGPGLDTRTGQGKIDLTNNECLSSLEEPIAKQTITDATALTNALTVPAIQLAQTTKTAGSAGAGQIILLGANSPILCASCVQKMAGNVVTLTASLVGVLSAGDYFIIEEVPDHSSSTSSSRKCVLKALNVPTATSVAIDATDSTFLNGGCQLTIPFDSQAWKLMKFNLRSHTVTDLTPGRDYSVRVLAINALGESVAATV